MTKCMILGLLDNVLQHHHVSMLRAYDVLPISMRCLVIRVGQLDKFLKTITNAKMSKGTPVINNMICMIKLFNEMKILGVEINEETQVDMVLKILLDFFK